jgi:hypothetical protein
MGSDIRSWYPDFQDMKPNIGANPTLSDLLMGCSTLVITNDDRILEMATKN